MYIEIYDTAELACERVAQEVTSHIKRNPATTLGLATGGTMLPVYENLRGARDGGEVSFAMVTTFNLDEYVGLRADHPGSYHQYMETHFFKGTKLDRGNTHLPAGDAPDPAAEADRYERLIAQNGGVNLQLLGIGRNGHIGFNEPGSSFASRTRVVELAPSTIEANRPYFSGTEQPPTQAITMGIATILEAERCLLLATGGSKKEAVAAMIEGPVDPEWPASSLQNHGNVTVILDRAAAAGLGPARS